MDEIRKMLPNDSPECVNVIRSAFLTVADELGFTKDNAPRFTAFAIDEDRLKNQSTEENRPMYVYHDHGKVVGYYSLAFLDNGSVEINNLSVLPEYRHIGIGESHSRHSGYSHEAVAFFLKDLCAVHHPWNGFSPRKVS